jgi:hypothetical protein
MATVRKQFRSPRSPDEVWAKLADFGRVHELAKGFVTATKLEEDGAARIVTFVNGVEIRERLVSSNDRERRLVYAITDSPRYQHYSASAEVFADAEGARFVWTVDFLPNEMEAMQNAAMEAGVDAMRRSLES